jgi:hypothetical protein
MIIMRITRGMYNELGMKPEYKTQMVQQDAWFLPRGVILGTCYLHTSQGTGESRYPQHLRKGQDLQQVRQVQVPIVAVARESGPEGCRSRYIGSQAQTHAPTPPPHTPPVPPASSRSPGPSQPRTPQTHEP